MIRFLLQRLGLSLVTLFLLSVIVFATAQLLPGDVGRNILGGFADQHSVDLLNHQLGIDKPVTTQYAHWVGHFFRGDLGQSLQYQVPVSNLLGPSLVNSLKLALEAFVIVVPLSIVGGVVAALKQGHFADRTITITGLSLTAVPEFVTAIVLIIIFGVVLGWLPVTATAPPGAGFLTQAKFLLLPALALVMVLFGYIARIARGQRRADESPEDPEGHDDEADEKRLRADELTQRLPPRELPLRRDLDRDRERRTHSAAACRIRGFTNV